MEVQTFKETIIQNMNSIEQYKGNDQVLANKSNKSGDESSRSRNKCNDKSTSGDDTDIRPSYDIEPMVEVPYTAKYNVFVVDTQHSEQPECINNTCVVEMGDCNVIHDLPDMCDNDIQNDQNVVECDDELTLHSWPHVKKSSFAKPYDVNAPGPSRKIHKHVSFKTLGESVSSNDMVHNYYLEEAKKKAQLHKDKALNTKPSVQQSARLPTAANGNKSKPRNFNQ
nr:hypothetical protein [Tanacetum cinerariifolium]